VSPPRRGGRLDFPVALAGVEQRLPREFRLVCGQHEAHRLPVRVDHEQQGVIDQRLAMGVELVERLAA